MRHTIRDTFVIADLLAYGTSEGVSKAWDTRGRGVKDMSHDEIHARLSHAVTDYDRKQSAKKYYNSYALPQYLAAVHDAHEKIKNGADPRKTLVAHFNGRLLDHVLKSVGEPKSTKEEQRGW